jgi:hypothetical protein
MLGRERVILFARTAQLELGPPSLSGGIGDFDPQSSHPAKKKAG